MGVTALVMAGGRGSRIAIDEEKPVLQLVGRPVILYVLAALRDAKKVKSIAVAISNHTPKTAKLMKELSVTTVQTPGKEYVSDMGYAVKSLKLETVLSIGADLPLITGEVVDAVLESYERCGKSALTVVVPVETKEKLRLSSDYTFSIGDRLVVPAGINVIDGKEIENAEIDQEICLLDDEKVAVNINTLQDLQIAEELISQTTARATKKRTLSKKPRKK
jgi:adenosylcobinamide-phosphate guanylyltransferase